MLFISLAKLSLLSRYLYFYPDFLVMLKNGLIKSIRLISKYMTPQPGKQTIAIHILTNISWSKGNRQFGQLKEYNIRNIFLEKSYIKCGGETIPRPFSKKSKLGISMDQWSKCLSILFWLYAKLNISKYIETKLQTTCFYLKVLFKKKNKNSLELVLLPHFLYDFRRKIFFSLYSIDWPNSIA